MTGFGHGSVESPWGQFEVTIRSLNHRFCAINAHLPDLFEPYELQIHDLIKKHVRRGRIEYRLDWEPAEGFEAHPIVNRRVLEGYIASLKSIVENYSIDGDIDIGVISRLPGVFSFEKGRPTQIEEMWTPVSEATDQAIEGLVRMREREGDAMKTVLAGLIGSIGTIQDEIEDQVPLRIEKARNRLQERIDDVLKGKEVDETRVLLEITLLADKWDISEELARLRSHMIQFEKTIDKEEAIGRRLTFLLQELLREVNTITSKAYDVEISHRAVEIKEIIEQIREQVENIE
jgi:uncharacterized protein (TIGR00255 family)